MGGGGDKKIMRDLLERVLNGDKKERKSKRRSAKEREKREDEKKV